jgi:hypothetical protein
MNPGSRLEAGSGVERHFVKANAEPKLLARRVKTVVSEFMHLPSLQ